MHRHAHRHIDRLREGLVESPLRLQEDLLYTSISCSWRWGPHPEGEKAAPGSGPSDGETVLSPCVFAIPGRLWQGETCPKRLGGHKLLQQVTNEASAVLAGEPS